MEDEKLRTKKMAFAGAVVLILAGIAALFYTVFIKDDGSKVSKDYLIIGNSLIWQKTNSSWKQIKELDDKILENKFTIYDGNTSEKNISLQYVNNQKWYFFDQNYKQIKMENFKAAATGFDIKLANYKEQQITSEDMVYINSVFNQNKVTDTNRYRTTKIVYDFDGDGKEEALYNTSNYVFDIVDYEINSFLYIVQDGKVYPLDKVSKVPFGIMEILDLDNDNQYEIIVSKGVMNLPTFSSCYMLYDYIDGDWKLAKQCR